MDIQEYQDLTRNTAVYKENTIDVARDIVATFPISRLSALLDSLYPAMGLAGEAGEIVQLLSKVLIRGDEIDAETLKKMVLKEIGDVLWFTARLASEFGLHLEDAMIENVYKLQDRKDRGVLKGSGDER